MRVVSIVTYYLLEPRRAVHLVLRFGRQVCFGSAVGSAFWKCCPLQHEFCLPYLFRGSLRSKPYLPKMRGLAFFLRSFQKVSEICEDLE